MGKGISRVTRKATLWLQQRQHLRAFVFVLSISVALVAISVSLGFSFGIARDNQAAGIRFADNVPPAIEARLKLSESLFQASILLLASVWGIALLNKKEAAVVFENGQEISMLVLVSVVLLVSFWAHFAYVREMTDAMIWVIDGEIANVTDFDTMYGLYGQIICIFSATIIAGLAVLSGRWLRPSQKRNRT